MKIGPVLQLFFCGAAMAQSQSPFTPTGNLIRARAQHTATLLRDGKVLIAGGVSYGNQPTYLATAELYDPRTGAFTAVGDMITPRGSHTATLLPDGRVLIAGGFLENRESAAEPAELYDPASGTFEPAGEMSRAGGQWWINAALLGNGKILFVGLGVTAQLYDSATGSFVNTVPYAAHAGLSATSTLLPDGNVLITSCNSFCAGGATQLYDPVANRFRVTGPMRGWSNVNTATLLMNGKVLIAGSNESADLADAELYDPAAGAFTAIGSAAAPHRFATAVLLPDGMVFLAGSQAPNGKALASAELYDPASVRFTRISDMITPRLGHTATLLSDGTVLLAGGYTTAPTPISAAELYRPSLPVAAPVLFSLSGDGQGQGAIWHSATGQVVSPANPAIAGEVLAMYTTGLGEGSLLPPQVAIGGRLAEIGFFGSAPGYPGFHQVNVRVPAGLTAAPAAPVYLTHIGRSSNKVTIAVQ